MGLFHQLVCVNDDFVFSFLFTHPADTLLSLSLYADLIFLIILQSTIAFCLNPFMLQCKNYSWFEKRIESPIQTYGVAYTPTILIQQIQAFTPTPVSHSYPSS